VKTVTIAISLLIQINAYTQKGGLEFLSYAKSSMESVISNYASAIPDTSIVYKKYYLSLAKSYNSLKANYSGYRGSLKDCILNNNSKKKIQNCLAGKTIDIKGSLDTLQSVMDQAYLEQYALQGSKTKDPTFSGHNSTLVPANFVSGLLDTLISGVLKVWDQTQKYKKQYRDDYLNNITNKDYDLSEIDDLLKRKIATSTK
jgi:hypothetical protein